MLPIEIQLPAVFGQTKIIIQPKITIGIVSTVILIALLFAAPFLFWVYHMQMAGGLLKSAINWSEVRQVDTLPQLQDQQQAERALAHLNRAIYWQPNDIYAYRLVAYVYMAQKDWSEAIKMIKKSQTFSKNHRLLLWEEGLIYEQLWQSAQTSQNPALTSRLKERLLQLWSQLDLNGEKLTQRGYEARKRRRYEEALKWYARAELMGVGLESGITYTRYISQLDKEEERLGAINLLEEAIMLDAGWAHPDERFRAWYQWGRLLFELKRYEESEATLQKTIKELYPGELEKIKSESLRILALAQIELGQPEEALQNLQDAVESNNQNFWALVGYGGLLYDLKPSQVAQSRQYFEDALRLQPKNVELSRTLILFWRGHLEIEQVRLLCEVAQAQNDALEIAEVCQATDGIEISGDKYFEYQALSAKGEQEEAAKALERAIELDAGWFSSLDRFRAWYQWGRWLLKQKQYAEAEGVLKQAVELYPEEGGATAILADVYRFLALSQGYQGKQEDALENLRLSLEYNDKNIWSHLQYGQTLHWLDPQPTSEADEAFATALSLQDEPNIWRNVIGFLLRAGEQERATEWCTQVAEKEFAEELSDLCE